MSSAGLYLHWEGNRLYKQRIPSPRLLEPVEDLSFGEDRQNLIIEGDNLQVLASLKNRYAGEVDVIYIDPPYNLGKNDFRYSDRRFHDPDADGSDAVYVTNEDGGKHTKWLNFIAPRLYMLWDLLREQTGIIFVSINDMELFRLGMLMNEIFGEENWIGTIVWQSNSENNPTRIAIEHEYILCYAKNKSLVSNVWSATDSEVKSFMLNAFQEMKTECKSIKELQTRYTKFLKEHKDYVGGLNRYNKVEERSPYHVARNIHNPKPGGYDYEIIHPNGQPCKKPSTGWRYPEESMEQLRLEDRIIFAKDHTQVPKLKEYLDEVTFPLRSVIEFYAGTGATDLQKLFKDKSVFKNAKPVNLIATLLDYTSSKNSLILDAFAGSGTTGEAVLRLNARDNGNRRFILIEEGNRKDRFCQTVTQERIRRAIKEYGYQAGFTFYQTGKKLDRTAIVTLEREALANLICQADATGRGTGITRISGCKYVIGKNKAGEAICLIWNGLEDSEVTRDDLVNAVKEINELSLKKTFRIYGTFCRLGDNGASWKFCQIPDEILAQMHLVEDEE